MAEAVVRKSADAPCLTRVAAAFADQVVREVICDRRREKSFVFVRSQSGPRR